MEPKPAEQHQKGTELCCTDNIILQSSSLVSWYPFWCQVDLEWHTLNHYLTLSSQRRLVMDIKYNHHFIHSQHGGKTLGSQRKSGLVSTVCACPRMLL